MPFLSELIVIGIMLVFNGFFSAYEMALASISRARIQVLLNEKRNGARESAYMKDRMEASLAVVQVGITLVGAIAAAIGGAGVSEWLAPHLIHNFGFSKVLAQVVSLTVLIIPLGGLTIVFELVPKMFALNHKEFVCLSLSPFMKALSAIAYPIIFIFEQIVKFFLHLGSRRMKNQGKIEPNLHELTAAVNLARTSRLIGAREEKIVLSAAQLSTRPVKNIMISAQDIVMIPIRSSLTDALIRAHLDMHTRFPVAREEGNPQTIEGYINFKDITIALKMNPEDPTIKGIIRPIKLMKEDSPISVVLEQMIQEKLHIALVVTPDGNIVGLVTLEDIIEELVGEIEDEFDRIPTYIHPYAGGWIMGGGVLMHSVIEIAKLKSAAAFKGEENLKLADWCERKFKGQLKGGEQMTINGLQITIRKLRRKRLAEAMIHAV